MDTKIDEMRFLQLEGTDLAKTIADGRKADINIYLTE